SPAALHGKGDLGPTGQGFRLPCLRQQGQVSLTCSDTDESAPELGAFGRADQQPDRNNRDRETEQGAQADESDDNSVECSANHPADGREDQGRRPRKHSTRSGVSGCRPPSSRPTSRPGRTGSSAASARVWEGLSGGTPFLVTAGGTRLGCPSSSPPAPISPA